VNLHPNFTFCFNGYRVGHILRKRYPTEWTQSYLVRAGWQGDAKVTFFVCGGSNESLAI
jgi:hypothetical protein